MGYGSRAGSAPAQIIRNDNSGTNITSAAYVQLTANVAAEINHIQIYNSAAQTLILAVGPAGGEVDTMYIMPSQTNLVQPFHCSSKTRLSVKSASATVSTGELTLNLYN